MSSSRKLSTDEVDALMEGLQSGVISTEGNIGPNAEVRPFLSTTLTRRWIPVGLLGGGYRQGVGNTYFQILVLYDAINNRDSPYRSEYLFGPSNLPIIIRGGLILGIGN